jgi:hypothetical protein
MSLKQITKIRTGLPDVDRALGHVADVVNPILRDLPTGGTRPTTPVGAVQTGVVYMGKGVPSNANGNSGDFYFRTDTPGTANQRLYVKNGTTWTGIL